jgi:hypothetical protein
MTRHRQTGCSAGLKNERASKSMRFGLLADKSGGLRVACAMMLR